MPMNVSPAVAAGLARAGITPAGGVNIANPSGGGSTTTTKTIDQGFGNKPMTITTTTTQPTYTGIKVTDFRSGESVRTNYSGGGSSSTYSPSPVGGGVGSQQALAIVSSLPSTESFNDSKASSILNSISNYIAPQQTNPNVLNQMTNQNYGKINMGNQEIHTQPYIMAEQNLDKNGKTSMAFKVVDPTGLGVQKERPATAQEIASLDTSQGIKGSGEASVLLRSGSTKGYWENVKDTSTLGEAVGGALTIASGGTFGLLSWKTAQIVLSEPISKSVSAGINMIVPKQDSGFALQGLVPQVERGALFLASAPVAGKAFATEIAKGLLTAPGDTASGLIDYASKNPYEFATMTMGEKVANYVKIRDLNIPQESGSYDLKLLGIETKKGRGMVLGSYSPYNGIGFGKPNVASQLKGMPETTELKLGSVLETKTIQKAIQSGDIPVTPRAEQLIDISQKILRSTQNVNSKFVYSAEKDGLLFAPKEDFLYSATERLPTEGVKLFLDLAKEENGILFGSKARAFQLAQEYKIDGENFKLNKVPRDIELRFDSAGELKMKEITNKAIERLKKLGNIKRDGKEYDLTTAREVSDTPYAIEAKIDNDFIKVAEFKGGKDIIDKEEVPEFVVGFKKTGKTFKIDGIESTKLNEELRGVSQGVLRVRKVKGSNDLDIYPSPKREKDIGSVSVSARTLQMSKNRLNVLGRVKLQRNIEKFESLFPEKLVRQQVEKVLSEKEVIADFSKKEPESFSSKTSRYLQEPMKYGRSFSVASSSEKYLTKSPTSSLSRSISSSEIKSTGASRSPRASKSPSISKSASVSMSDISPYMSASPRTTNSPSPFTSPSPSKSMSPYRSSSPSDSPYYNYPKRKRDKSESLLFDEPKRKKKRVSSEGFDLFEIKNKKPYLVRTGLTKSSALDLGTSDVLSDLRATFFLRKSKSHGVDIGGTGEFGRALSEGLFRKPVRKSKYNQLSDMVFVQRQSGNSGRLRSRGEKLDIVNRKKNKRAKRLQYLN